MGRVEKRSLRRIRFVHEGRRVRGRLLGLTLPESTKRRCANRGQHRVRQVEKATARPRAYVRDGAHIAVLGQVEAVRDHLLVLLLLHLGGIIATVVGVLGACSVRSAEVCASKRHIRRHDGSVH